MLRSRACTGSPEDVRLLTGLLLMLALPGCVGERSEAAGAVDVAKAALPPATSPSEAAGNASVAAPGETESEQWTIVPRERVGPVTERTSRADLVGLFASENVRDRWVYLAEDFCTWGTVVFAASPDELEITWRTDERLAPATARIRTAGGRWVTHDGVRIGTTLKELEAMKGEPFTFGGFGWDYGGGAVWNGLGLRLGPDDDGFRRHSTNPRLGEIMGERSVRSDHPLIRDMTVRVEMMELSWAFPSSEVECPEDAF